MAERYGAITSSLSLAALQSVRRNAADAAFEAFTPAVFGTAEADRIESGDSPYNVVATDEVIFCDTDGGAIIVNFPAGAAGRRLKVANCGSNGNAVTLNANGAETIHDEASQTLYDGEVLDLNFDTTEGWW